MDGIDCYRRHGPALRRKCERMLGNHQDAEDIVQTLFTELLLRGEGAWELPYLYRAATNRCLNLLRDRGRRASLLARQQPELTPPSRVGSEEQLIGAELLARLLDRLDDRCAEVLVYRYCDDLTQQEIAELLDTSRKTVGKRLDRIRAAMQDLAPLRAGGVR